MKGCPMNTRNIFILYSLLVSTACASEPSQTTSGAGGSGGQGNVPIYTGSGGVPAATDTSPIVTAGAGEPAVPGDGTDCGALSVPLDSDALISTFEDGTGSVNPAAGRGTYGFYAYNDGTGTQEPPPSDTAAPAATAEAHCDSQYALCTSGSGFTEWGAGIGHNLGPEDETGTKTAIDLSAYKGISFWAKSRGGTPVVKFAFKDQNTDPAGGICDENEPSGDTACHNDYKVMLTFTPEWAPYTVMFSELAQDSTWGLITDAFTVNAVYGLQFQVEQGLDFDYCIDDIFFVQ